MRNTSESRAFIDAATALYPLYKNVSLPEQSAMTAVAFLNYTLPGQQDRCALHHHFVIAPQRIINSLINAGFPYTPHPKSVAWQPGDFLAHYAGIDSSRRGILMRDMASTIINGSLPR